MKIKSIDFENFKGLKNQKILFDDDLTVIVGKNGAGKSSVLEATSICLSWIIARIKASKGIGSYINEDNVKIGCKNSEIKASFDEIQSFSIPSKTKPGMTKTKSAVLDNLNAYTCQVQEKIESNNYNVNIPVFAYYGVKRAVIVPPLRAKNKDFTLLDSYSDALNGAANFKSFFEWFRNEEDIENEMIRNNVTQNDYQRNLNAVRKALSIFLPEFTNIHISRRPLQMVIEKDGKRYNINQLSDGEKIYIALIGDLCKRLVLANPTLEDPLIGEGIVLIDEIDLHLHPNWQRNIVSRLKDAFPNIQFIITTHSPHVINSVPSKSLRIMNYVDGEIIIENSDKGYGLPSLVVLKDIMDMEYDLPIEVAELRNDLYHSLNEGNVEDIKIKYEKLSELSPYLPDLSYLRKKIERLSK